MTAGSRKTWKLFEQFLRFWTNDPLWQNSSKICYERLHGDTDRRCCVQMSSNLFDSKSVKSCVIRMTETKTKFRLPLKFSILRGTPRIAPKICQAQPPTFDLHCNFIFYPTRFSFGGVIYSRSRQHVQSVLLPLGYFEYSPSGE